MMSARLVATVVVLTTVVGCSGEGVTNGAAVERAGARVAALPRPAFHHIHINSVDPDRTLDWWSTFWPAGEPTTFAGLPAFAADGIYLLYTQVDDDPTRRQSIPQSPFWRTGPSTDGLALYERLTALDPDGGRFGFLSALTTRLA